MTPLRVPAACITTSWDDGHPLDLRLAELLAKYGLRGTFYVPRTAETETMTLPQLRELSEHFEIGAHTLHHVDLAAACDPAAWQEIVDSRAWIEYSVGQPCPMFCPPKGHFATRHLRMIEKAGYQGARSVELLSLDFPRGGALLLMPTTLQAHPHGLLAYARNALRRGAFRNLWLYAAHGRSTDWTRLARALLHRVLKRGGVFHLWGHSWEVEQTGQWQQLEEVLRYLGQHTQQADVLTNGQLCQPAQAGAVGRALR
jgi:peptidoglycan/xylan/chitin deacetylase (PgdA/CDA1 family)